MPRMNGTDLCGHLMEERPGIKVLMMSGADMREIVSQNANMPFLPKPFNGETLKARVRAILRPLQFSQQPICNPQTRRSDHRLGYMAQSCSDTAQTPRRTV